MSKTEALLRKKQRAKALLTGVETINHELNTSLKAKEIKAHALDDSYEHSDTEVIDNDEDDTDNHLKVVEEMESTKLIKGINTKKFLNTSLTASEGSAIYFNVDGKWITPLWCQISAVSYNKYKKEYEKNCRLPDTRKCKEVTKTYFKLEAAERALAAHNAFPWFFPWILTMISFLFLSMISSILVKNERKARLAQSIKSHRITVIDIIESMTGEGLLKAKTSPRLFQINGMREKIKHCLEKVGQHNVPDLITPRMIKCESAKHVKYNYNKHETTLCRIPSGGILGGIAISQSSDSPRSSGTLSSCSFNDVEKTGEMMSIVDFLTQHSATCPSAATSHCGRNRRWSYLDCTTGSLDLEFLIQRTRRNSDAYSVDTMCSRYCGGCNSCDGCPLLGTNDCCSERSFVSCSPAAELQSNIEMYVEALDLHRAATTPEDLLKIVSKTMMESEMMEEELAIDGPRTPSKQSAMTSLEAGIDQNSVEPTPIRSGKCLPEAMEDTEKKSLKETYNQKSVKITTNLKNIKMSSFNDNGAEYRDMEIAIDTPRIPDTCRPIMAKIPKASMDLIEMEIAQKDLIYANNKITATHAEIKVGKLPCDSYMKTSPFAKVPIPKIEIEEPEVVVVKTKPVSTPKKAGPPPPPPPMPIKSAKKLRTSLSSEQDSPIMRQPKVIELFQSVRNTSMNGAKRQLSKQSSNCSTLSSEPSDGGSLIRELEKNSKYFAQIQNDIKNMADTINKTIEDINTHNCKTMGELDIFVIKVIPNLFLKSSVDRMLDSLTDESAVLKCFNWPAKYYMYREALSLWQEFRSMKATLTNWKKGKGTAQVELTRMQKAMEGTIARFDVILQTYEEDTQKYIKNGIPWDKSVMLEVRHAAVLLMDVYMSTILAEFKNLQSNPKNKNKNIQLLQNTVKLAFKLHQFAGGLSQSSPALIEEIAGHMKILVSESDS